MKIKYVVLLLALLLLLAGIAWADPGEINVTIVPGQLATIHCDDGQVVLHDIQEQYVVVGCSYQQQIWMK